MNREGIRQYEEESAAIREVASSEAGRRFIEYVVWTLGRHDADAYATDPRDTASNLGRMIPARILMLRLEQEQPSLYDKLREERRVRIAAAQARTTGRGEEIDEIPSLDG